VLTFPPSHKSDRMPYEWTVMVVKVFILDELIISYTLFTCCFNIVDLPYSRRVAVDSFC
jgi:hypothetical protein